MQLADLVEITLQKMSGKTSARAAGAALTMGLVALRGGTVDEDELNQDMARWIATYGEPTVKTVRSWATNHVRASEDLYETSRRLDAGELQHATPERGTFVEPDSAAGERLERRIKEREGQPEILTLVDLIDAYLAAGMPGDEILRCAHVALGVPESHLTPMCSLWIDANGPATAQSLTAWAGIHARRDENLLTAPHLVEAQRRVDQSLGEIANEQA